MGSDQLPGVADNHQENVLGLAISDSFSVSIHNTDAIIKGSDQQSTLSLFIVIGESSALRVSHLELAVEDLLTVIGDLEVSDTVGGIGHS